jgi:cystathionine beta-lyase
MISKLGNIWNKEKIDKIVQLTHQYHSLLLIDEIYCDLVWRGDFHTPIKDELYEHVIVCRGFSKT